MALISRPCRRCYREVSPRVSFGDRGETESPRQVSGGWAREERVQEQFPEEQELSQEERAQKEFPEEQVSSQEWFQEMARE
ncbi:hypothetical protein NPIL_628291 [Nephila pilipes]|uniref:Uncharacterized protein n=1 Tax=Nephila pilipes TaxID=299642 RepID=A0A8X6PNW8_NEPPI|nr:hypothetical protein NPIL_628291 [Nephila pilipes]